MTFIEGVGDEVTAFFVVTIVLILATLITFIGGGSSFYSTSPARSPTAPSVYIQQVSEAVNDSDVNARTTSSDNSNVPRPADIGFRNSMLPNEDVNIHPSAPLPDVVEEEAQNSDNENRTSAAHYPDIPQADIPSTHRTAEESHQRTSTEIGVRLKYLDDTMRTVSTEPKITIREFKRTHFPDELASNRTVRLIFCGHLLHDDATLDFYHVIDNSVLHVQILQAQPAGSQQTEAANANDLDIGHLMYPLFALILGICWTALIRFPEFFNALSISILALLTAGYVIAYGHR